MRIILHRDPFHDARAEPAGFAPAFDGVVAMIAFPRSETAESEVPLAEGQPFHGSVLIDGTDIAFAIEGVRDEDELHVRFLSETHAVAEVRHVNGDPPNCRAVCSDGTSGFPCVTCQSGNVTARICC